MPDIAGAKKAIREKFENDWAELDFSPLAGPPPVQLQNTEPPQTPWPPHEFPWVYLEIIDTGNDLRGAGTPGNHAWLYTGTIFVHIFVPIDYGIDDVEQWAVKAGDIFKAQTFYNAPGTGVKVICGAPALVGGGSDADKGTWFRLTMSIPFEYYHLG